MCGLFGQINFDRTEIDPGVLTPIGQRLIKRGPDAAGFFTQGSVALGHRRLKVIDLSEASSQPMIDAELGLGIVFNGAIYNYPELRKELQGKGYRFFSNGD